LEVFRGQFQLLTDDGRMFATESSEPDSVGNQYSGLTHFGALLERTKRTIRANRANDPSERSERTIRANDQVDLFSGCPSFQAAQERASSEANQILCVISVCGDRAHAIAV
jgi:hypothetical protein